MFNTVLKIMQRRKSNLTKPHGPIRNTCIYKTNSNTRTNLQSSSFVVYPPGNKNEQNRTHRLKNSATQTSRTVITLPLVDTNRMSPDSLSPKTEYKIFTPESNVSSQESLPNNNESNLRFTRKQYLLKALEERRGDRFCTGDTLTKVFLEKNRNKNSSERSNKLEVSTNPEASTRSKFLQQTSPLRNLVAASIKSKSFVECPRSECSSYDDSSVRTRFKVTSVGEKQDIDDEDSPEPVRYYCANVIKNVQEARSRSPKCVTFMSPTIASEIKSQVQQIEDVRRRISPIRKGRSVSPKRMNKNERRLKHVPYIDKSCSTIRTAYQDIDIEYDGGEDDTVVVDLEVFENSSELSQELNTDTSQSSYADLCQAMLKLREDDWNTALLGLADIVEICRLSDRDFIYPHMTVINQRVIELLKSCRSHVCRTTCQAVGHLFEYVKDTRRPEFDEVVDVLLCKTADSNKFIRHDANLALDCMVTHIPILHSVRALSTKGPDHKNALVRTATARLVVCAVVLSGVTAVLEPNNNDFTKRRIIFNMVRFLNDKAYETRKFGARLYKLLSKDPLFEGYLKKYLEKETVLQIHAYMKSRLKK